MIIISVAPAQPQNNSDVPFCIPYGMNTPTKPNVMIATSANPMISSNFAIFLLIFLNQKDIWFCKSKKFMDKYLLVILIFMVVTMPIAFVEPSSGEFRDPPLIPLFYAAIAGIIIIFVYSTYKERNERQAANAKRRSRK